MASETNHDISALNTSMAGQLLPQLPYVEVEVQVDVEVQAQVQVYVEVQVQVDKS